jgi:nitroreductase
VVIGAREIGSEELLTTTRAVRRGLDLSRSVDIETVQDCLRIALQAPTGSNRQHWRWIVLTDPDVRAAVAEIYRAAFTARSSTMDQSGLTRDAGELAAKLHLVPVLVIPCLQLEKLPSGNQSSVWSSLLPAAWNYALAARTRGLATTWTTVHLDREREVADVLGLPADVHQGCLLPTAYPRKTTFRPAPRRPLDEVLHVNGWEEKP